jgi:hypothetical protein
MGKQQNRRRGNKQRGNPLNRVSAGIQQGTNELVVKEEQLLPVITKVSQLEYMLQVILIPFFFFFFTCS